jgi:hypothetical protein
MENHQLLTQGQVLQNQVLSGSKSADQQAKQMPKPTSHG